MVARFRAGLGQLDALLVCGHESGLVEKVFMRFWGRVLPVAVSLLVTVSAAHAVAPQRIMKAIDSAETSELHGNMPAALRRATDLGSAPEDLALTELSLRFTMTDAQQEALTQLLADQQNPASERYHQWLTPEQFGEQFGLAPADLQKVSSWLKSQGFTVTEVARGGMFLRFSGTVAQAESAFHTQLHKVSVDGENHIANVTEPELPSAIAAVTGSITGLHDFHFKPHNHFSSIATSPRYTSSASGNHFIAPGDFYTIYNENPLLTAGTNGTGVTIAVMGQIDISLSDIATFRSLGGLPANVPTQMLYGRDPGSSDSSDDQLESELDVEWAGATAPSASILFVRATDVIDGSLTETIDNNLAPIISISYGDCESDVGQNSLNSYNALVQMANTQGQTIIASSGDSGATDCEYQTSISTTGFAVDFPASFPGVTGIGGTMFNEGSGTYWSSANGANMGSALSYIPEAVWNEDSDGGELGSGGGGVSLYFPKPAWQAGLGVPADASRDVPDVALNAAADHDGYLICTPGFCTNGYKNSSGSHDIVGGTSVGAPTFAGLLALVEQRIGGRIGNANPTIYALANSIYYASVFHDVTMGDNESPCRSGTTDCPAGGSIGYTASIGYDLASGWGTVDAFNMVNSWSLVTPVVSTTGQAVSTTLFSVAPQTAVQGTNVTLTATVSGRSNPTTPTGTVQFLLDNVAVGDPVPLIGEAASYSLDTTSISWGTHTAQAVYSGDSTFAGSKDSAAVTITSSSAPDFSLTPATTTVTTKSGSSAAGITLTLTGLNSFTGNVQLSASAVSDVGIFFSPSVVNLSNAKTVNTSTLTLEAFGTRVVSAARPATLWFPVGSGIAMAGVLMLVMPKRRRFVGLLAAAISIGVIGAAGCGGGGSPSGSNNGATSTPAGTYTITVTAAGTSGSTSVTHTAIVTFIVQ